MSGADWIIIGAVLLSAVLAASQGFFYEVISLAGTIVAFLIASWAYRGVAEWIEPHVSSEMAAQIIAFLVIFAIVVVLAGVLARLARWALRKAGLRWIDRVLGAFFGVVRGSLIVAVVLMSVTAFEPASNLLTGSQLAPYFLIVGRAAMWLAPSELRMRFYDGLGMLGDAHTQNLPLHSPPADHQAPGWLAS